MPHPVHTDKGKLIDAFPNFSKASKKGLIITSFLVKGKAVPLQTWSGQEDSRKLRFPDFMTRAQDDGTVVSLTHRPPLLPGNTPGTHFC
jgi:hypothetical protein